MKKSPFVLVCILVLSLLTPVRAATAADRPVPRLEKRGDATQLIVDGQPWLIRGGEVANTASSSLAYMDTVWPKLTRLNLNTVLVSVAWAWVEPEEGKFDFSLVDGLLAGARQNHQRVVFLWFGSWKNGVSSFVPDWVKTDQTRFPRVRLASGKSTETVTPLSPAALEADTRAYVKFMEHLAQTDATDRTTLMIQLQNEVGVLGDSRDRGDAANAAFTGPVPAELTAYLTSHKGSLTPGLEQVWTAAGARTSGTWAEIFGSGPATDELFMAWHYARYMGHMAAAGKTAYPLPVFTNTWIVQPEDKVPGDYPSGGAQPLTLDLWKAGAPAIDLNCPDVYLPDFDQHVIAFHRPDNPIFIPESRGDAAGIANAFYAIGAHASLGYSPFGIDNTGRLVTLRPNPGDAQPANLEDLPLAKGYAVLRDLAPLILDHQARGTIRAAWLNRAKPSQEIALGDYTLTVELRRNSRDQAYQADLGCALVFALDAEDFLIAGTDVQVTFTPRTPGAPIAGIAHAETVKFSGGSWTTDRRMSGDDILLNYHLAQQADANQSGSGLRFGPAGPVVQRVKLYRYR
jgi:hypothetical protein